MQNERMHLLYQRLHLQQSQKLLVTAVFSGFSGCCFCSEMVMANAFRLEATGTGHKNSHDLWSCREKVKESGCWNDIRIYIFLCYIEKLLKPLQLQRKKTSKRLKLLFHFKIISKNVKKYIFSNIRIASQFCLRTRYILCKQRQLHVKVATNPP